MYARRSKFDPYWNSILVGGFKNGKRYAPSFYFKISIPTLSSSFLGYVDLLGTTFSASTLATGYGLHIAQPLLRKAVEGRETTLTEEEAREIIRTCMRVLFYRDARSLNQFQIATVNQNGVTIGDSESVSTDWRFAEGIRGYGPQNQ